jgi:hypothetical protein
MREERKHIMAHILNILGSTTPAPLSPEEEAELITAAAYGHPGAFETLLQQYAPAIRRALRKYGETMEADDAEQEVALAFLDLIKTHDPEKNPSLAGRVATALNRELAEAASAGTGGWTIPARTMERYLAIVKKADGDLAEARRIAPEHDMKVSTFDAVTAATRTDSLTAPADGETDYREAPAYAVDGDDAPDPFESVLDAELVALAFAVTSPEETTVVRQAYGFEPAVVDGHEMRPEGHAPLSDALVAASVGLSRPKTQRVRTGALVKMREALEVAA